ncbi:MAG: hypothetical protein ACOC0U_06630 [Desulfovibrionales bacterium]
MNKQKSSSEPVVHGLILGGSLGLIASWFGMDPGRSVMLGLISGLLAGLTKFFLDRKLKK